MTFTNRVRAFLAPDLAHMIDLQDSLIGMLSRGHTPPGLVAAFLDDLDHRGRLAALRGLSGGCLARLFELVDGFRRITIDDVVPPSRGAREEVRHHGKNSLPAFTIFEKRFLRPEPGSRELWGYNFQALRPVTGPGYFVAYDAPDRGEVDVDYTRIPPEAPLGWPELAPNERGISTLVYAHMVDRLRGVTAQVSIGRAWKKGKVQPAWFVLCRE
jgi:hypothetical protein